MKKYQFILFDLDGTLTDPKEGITESVAYALRHFGIEVENLDTLCKFIGPPLKESFIKFYGLSEENAVLAVEKYRENFVPRGLFQNKMYEGVDRMLEHLKQSGKHIILATSKPMVFARQILEHFGLASYFDCIVGSELDGSRVEKADVIAYALEQANVQDIQKAVMVGDREHDIIGAKENHLDSIGVLYGYGDMQEFQANGADYVAATVEELEKMLMTEQMQAEKERQ